MHMWIVSLYQGTYIYGVHVHYIAPKVLGYGTTSLVSVIHME